MKVTVNLPDALFAQADGRVRFEIETEGDTVASILDALRREMPGVHQRLLTEQGQVRPHVNIFVGDESIRWSGGLGTRVADGAEVHVIPAVSGGRPPARDRFLLEARVRLPEPFRARAFPDPQRLAGSSHRSVPPPPEPDGLVGLILAPPGSGPDGVVLRRSSFRPRNPDGWSG